MATQNEFVRKLKDELFAAQTIFNQAQADRLSARKALEKAEKAFDLAHTKVDTVKDMLISALEAAR